MNQNKMIQPLLVIVIIACIGVVGYLFLGPNNQTTSQNQTANGSVPMVNGKQIIKMTVNAVTYQPNNFTVKAGVPVEWQITSSGQPGCDSGEVITHGLTNPIYLNPNAGQVTMADFTPQTPGTYSFSCPMGMVRGTIQVVN